MNSNNSNSQPESTPLRQTILVSNFKKQKFNSLSLFVEPESNLGLDQIEFRIFEKVSNFQKFRKANKIVCKIKNFKVKKEKKSSTEFRKVFDLNSVKSNKEFVKFEASKSK